VYSGRQIQLTAIRLSGAAFAMVEVNEEIGQVLIPPGVFLVPRPQRILIQLQMLVLRVAEYHGAQASIANGQGLCLPIDGRLPVPENQRLR
jgi:hypothetical protein